MKIPLVVNVSVTTNLRIFVCSRILCHALKKSFSDDYSISEITKYFAFCCLLTWNKFCNKRLKL